MQKVPRSASRRPAAFTLTELLIVVSIIAMLTAIAVPNFLRARKRTQAFRVLEDLRVIDSAIDQYAIETSRSNGNTVNWTDIKAYLKTGSKLYHADTRDLLGNPINGGEFTVGTHPRIPSATFSALSDIAPADFWSPFY